jgi:hypothetical protein
MQIFTITIHSDAVITKLESLGRKKGEYITKLIENDILIQNRISKLEEEVKELKERNRLHE